MPAETSSGSDRRCIVCDRVLGPHERAAGDICHSLRCRAGKALRVRDEEARARRADEAAAFVWFGLAHCQQGAPQVGVVPSFDRALVAPDPSRIEQLRLSLESAAVGIPALTDPPSPFRSADTDPPHVAHALSSACGLCGGECCVPGSTHAFLTAEELASKLAQAPGLTVEQLVAAYLAALPALSYEGSCVFHGARGCALDRSARSRVCNEYRCRGLSELATDLEQQRPDRVHLASVQDGQVRRAVTIGQRPASTSAMVAALPNGPASH